MKRLLLSLILILSMAACSALPPAPHIVTATPFVITATPEASITIEPSQVAIVTATPSPTLEDPTPTRERPTVDCGSYTIADGWHVDNNNPCLAQPIANRVNPSDPNDVNDQWHPSGYELYWRRYTTISPIVNYVRRTDGVGVRYRVDVGYRDGEFGYLLRQNFYNVGVCYLVKLTITTSLRPQPNVNDPDWLSSISVAGRITSNSRSQDLVAQSIASFGTQEFIWAIVSPESAAIELFYRIQWASAVGEIVFEKIEVLETPQGTSYCNGDGVIRF